jgi:hypothetical protein
MGVPLAFSASSRRLRVRSFFAVLEEGKTFMRLHGKKKSRGARLHRG